MPHPQVDCHCTVPSVILDNTALRGGNAAFMRATADARSKRLDPTWFPPPAPTPPRCSQAAKPAWSVDLGADGAIEALLALPSRRDAKVTPLRHTKGGPKAALVRWRRYVSSGGLKSYANHRNNPLAKDGLGACRMSAYVNLGMIDVHTMARDAVAAGSHKFLDEFVGFRESPYLWCLRYPAGYANAMVAVPAWGREQLGGGAPCATSGPSLEDLEAGRSGDPWWDDCQRSLVFCGELHNNARMACVLHLRCPPLIPHPRFSSSACLLARISSCRLPVCTLSSHPRPRSLVRLMYLCAARIGVTVPVRLYPSTLRWGKAIPAWWRCMHGPMASTPTSRLQAALELLILLNDKCACLGHVPSPHRTCALSMEHRRGCGHAVELPELATQSQRRASLQLQPRSSAFCHAFHRYALDGGAPPSYGGLLWCLGWRDRPGSNGCPTARPTSVLARRLKAGDLERLARWRVAPALLGASGDAKASVQPESMESHVEEPISSSEPQPKRARSSVAVAAPTTVGRGIPPRGSILHHLLYSQPDLTPSTREVMEDEPSSIERKLTPQHE